MIGCGAGTSPLGGRGVAAWATFRDHALRVADRTRLAVAKGLGAGTNGDSHGDEQS
jgi:hypothetical protein